MLTIFLQSLFQAFLNLTAILSLNWNLNSFLYMNKESTALLHCLKIPKLLYLIYFLPVFLF